MLFQDGRLRKSNKSMRERLGITTRDRALEVSRGIVLDLSRQIFGES